MNFRTCRPNFPIIFKADERKLRPLSQTKALTM